MINGLGLMVSERLKTGLSRVNLMEVGIMPSKYRNYFMAAEIARAFDVPVDKIEAVAGKKVYLNQISDVREAVLGVHSNWIGNGFTVDECNRLMGFKADNIDPLRVFEGITITLDPDTGEGIVPLDDVIHGYNIYKYQYDNGYWD